MTKSDVYIERKIEETENNCRECYSESAVYIAGWQAVTSNVFELEEKDDKTENKRVHIEKNEYLTGRLGLIEGK